MCNPPKPEVREWQIEKNSEVGHRHIAGPDTIGIVGQLTRVRVVSREDFKAVCKERDEARAALRFDVDSNSATGWMVKYQRQLAVNETQKKNTEHLLACEAVYRKERAALAAQNANCNKLIDDLNAQLAEANAQIAIEVIRRDEAVGWNEAKIARIGCLGRALAKAKVFLSARTTSQQYELYCAELVKLERPDA